MHACLSMRRKKDVMLAMVQDQTVFLYFIINAITSVGNSIAFVT